MHAYCTWKSLTLSMSKIIVSPLSDKMLAAEVWKGIRNSA